MTWGKATDAQLLQVLQETYVSLGILPFPGPPKSTAPQIGTKKSIQYSVRHYVDVKVCKPLGWNMVGNGASYELCGHIWYDEGKGCLEVQDHPDRNVYVRLIAGTCFRFECPVCYKKTCARASGRIAERFERIPKAQGSRDRSAEASVPGLGRPIHLIVSVPEDEAHLVDGQTLKVHGGKFNLKSN
ncbi:unnamed protein product, partial [marine sediment metagenome]